MAARILGVHETAKPAATTSRYPNAGWGREFVSKRGGGPLPESTTEAQLVKQVLAKVRPHTDAGGGCVVSIKADMVSVGKGRWDSRFTAVGHALDGLNAIVIPWHEPENDLTASVFVPAHNRALEAFKAGSSALEVGYAGITYQWRPGSKTTADPRAWTQDLHADWYLADVYFGQNFSSALTLGTHPGLQRWLAEMVLPYGRRWGLAEWGRLAEPDRPAGFQDDIEWLTADPIGRTCAMALVWGTGGTEGNPGWLLDQAAEDVIREGLARLAIPAGYRVSDLAGVLVCETGGCLVASDLTELHGRTTH